MTTFIQYQLDENTTVLIEAPDNTKGGIVKAPTDGKNKIVEAGLKFQEALKGAKAQAKVLLDEINEFHVEEAEIKFGLTTTGELGILAVGKVGLDINYEITLK